MDNVVVPPSETVPPPVMPVPGLTVTELLASWPLTTAPLNCDAGSVPFRISAVMAYGEGRICWRGASAA